MGVEQKCTRYTYTHIVRVSCHKMIQQLAIMSLNRIVAYNVRVLECVLVLYVYVRERAFCSLVRSYIRSLFPSTLSTVQPEYFCF